MKFSTTFTLAFAGFAAAVVLPAGSCTSCLTIGSLDTILSNVKSTLETNVLAVKSAISSVTATGASELLCAKDVINSLAMCTASIKYSKLQLVASLPSAGNTLPIVSNILPAKNITYLTSTIKKVAEIAKIIIDGAAAETALVTSGFTGSTAVLLKAEIQAVKAALPTIVMPLLAYAKTIKGDGIGASATVANLALAVVNLASQVPSTILLPGTCPC